jgi:dihydroneopterin aldolase
VADIVVGPSQDRIFLEGMEFHGYIGVHALEKMHGQPFVLDVALFCPCLEACESDRLVDTIDYGEVFARVRTQVETAECDLIEKLAGLIAADLLATYELACAVEVTVRKPQAPINGQIRAVGVTIRRERS